MQRIYTPYTTFSADDIRTHGADLLGEKDQGFNGAFMLMQQWLNGAGTFVFHTSGSTGVPKEIVLKRSQLQASADATINALSLGSQDHVLVHINTQFIGGAMLLIRGLLMHAAITLTIPGSDPLDHIPPDHAYTFASFVPMQLYKLTQQDARVLQKMNRFKKILVGGGAIPPGLEEQLKSLSTQVYHTYGMTETVSHIALKLLGRDRYFNTLPGVELATDDRNCLRIKSGSTDHQWIQTNDVVNMISSTSFEVLGRADEVINTGGIKVFPAGIEKEIRSIMASFLLPEISFFVSWQSDEKLGQKIIAVFECDPFEAEITEKIFSELKKRLHLYEVPKAFFFSSSFIMTPSGKINISETLKMI